MRGRRRELFHRQTHNLVEPQGAVARQPPMLGRDFPGLVDELPRGIGEDCREPSFADEGEQVLVNGVHKMTAVQ